MTEAVAAARAQGWEVGARASAWTGWPFAAELTLGNASVRDLGPGAAPGLDWHGEQARLRISLRHPTLLQIVPDGAQTLAWAGYRPVGLRSERMRAVIDLRGRDPVRIGATRLAATLPAGPVMVDAASVTLLGDGAQATAQGLRLPGFAAPVDALEGRITISPPITPGPTLSDMARAWRQAGGQVSLERVTLRWDRLTAGFHGRFGLDTSLQPEGSGELTASGLPDFLDRLAAAGMVPTGSAVAAKAVVAVLAAPSPGRPLALPVALQDGILTIARFPLLRTAPIAWD